MKLENTFWHPPLHTLYVDLDIPCICSWLPALRSSTALHNPECILSCLPVGWRLWLVVDGGTNRIMEQIVTEGGQMSKHAKRKERAKGKGCWSKKESDQNQIKTGDIVLQSSPFAFVILATHRWILSNTNFNISIRGVCDMDPLCVSNFCWGERYFMMSKS